MSNSFHSLGNLFIVERLLAHVKRTYDDLPLSGFVSFFSDDIRVVVVKRNE
jgi:hypothetical protein